MSTFRVVGTTTVADTGFVSLSQCDVEGPNDESFTRVVVHHPGAVVVVPVEADHETVLMVRQWRVATGSDLLEVPAGKRDVHGEVPVATAQRELHEEIGYRAGAFVKLCEFFNSPGFCDEYTHLFLALDLAAEEAPSAVNPEERAMTTERVRLADVDELIARRQIVDAKSIIGLTLARAFLAGRYAGLSG